MWFRLFQTLPHGTLKIPSSLNICFVDVPGEIITLAVEAGETAAKVEQVQEEQVEQSEKVENLEQQIKWNDQALDNAFERIWTMESTIEELKGKVAALESLEDEPEEDPEEEPEEDPMEDVTTLEPPTPPPAADPPKAKKSWSLF